MNLKKMIFSLTVIICLASSATTSAQEQSTGQYLGFGYNLSTSLDKTKNNQTAFGLVYENRFAKNLGIETGFYSRNFYYSLYKNRHLEVPVLLKFYSDAINISAGVSGGLFAGSKSYYGNVYIDDNYKYSLSAIVKVGHDFYLSESLIIEPEIVAIPFAIHTDNKQVMAGLGVKIKYLF